MFTLQKRSSYVVMFMLLFRYVASVNQTWDSEYKTYCTSVRNHVFTPPPPQNETFFRQIRALLVSKLFYKIKHYVWSHEWMITEFQY